MTLKQQLLFLLDIQSEATKWDVDREAGDNAYELEVRERIKNLVEELTGSDEDGEVEEPELDIHIPDNPVDEPLTGADYKALEAAKLDDYLEDKRKAYRDRKNANAAEYRKRNVRVHINGKPVWKPRNQCVQIPNSNGQLRWIWQPTPKPPFITDEIERVRETAPKPDLNTVPD